MIVTGVIFPDMFCWHDFVEGTKQQECSYSYHSIAAVNVDSEKCRFVTNVVRGGNFVFLLCQR